MRRQPKHPATVPALPTLANSIREAHMACIEAAMKSVEEARRCGELLLQAKTQVDHGKWGAWIEANCGFANRTARMYMQIAERWSQLDEAKRQRVAEMSVRQAVVALRDETKAKRTPKPASTIEDREAAEDAAELNEFRKLDKYLWRPVPSDEVRALAALAASPNEREDLVRLNHWMEQLHEHLNEQGAAAEPSQIVEQSAYQAAIDETARMRLQNFLREIQNGATEMTGRAIREEGTGRIIGRHGGGINKMYPEIKGFPESPSRIANGIQRDAGNPLYRRVLEASRQYVEETLGEQIAKAIGEGPKPEPQEPPERKEEIGEIMATSVDVEYSLTKERIELIRRSILAMKPKDRDEVLEELEQGTGFDERRELKRYASLRAANMIALGPRGQGRGGRGGRVAKGRGAGRVRKYTVEERLNAAVQFLGVVNVFIYERLS